jgi:antitoxin YefM
MRTMAIKNNIFPVDELANKIKKEPVMLKGDSGSMVVLSVSDWKSIQETLYLISIPGMEQSIIEGMNTPIEECKELIL